MSNFTHPDSAWSPVRYVAPKGNNAEACGHRHTFRQCIGPTSRKKGFMVLVDSCCDCHTAVRTINDVSWRQFDWLRRWNRSIRQSA